MTAAEFSLLAVSVSFVTLVVWVYWPSRRKRLESYGEMPLDKKQSPPGAGNRKEDRA